MNKEKINYNLFFKFLAGSQNQPIPFPQPYLTVGDVFMWEDGKVYFVQKAVDEHGHELEHLDEITDGSAMWVLPAVDVVTIEKGDKEWDNLRSFHPNVFLKKADTQILKDYTDSMGYQIERTASYIKLIILSYSLRFDMVYRSFEIDPSRKIKTLGNLFGKVNVQEIEKLLS